MSKEAMKLALEALERYQVKRQDFDRFADEITALRQAIEQVEQAQPVACIACDQAHAVLDADESKIIRDSKDGYPEGRKPRVLTLAERVSALCTYAADWKRWCLEKEAAPPPRQPLTDDQILASNYPDGEENGPTITAPDSELIAFARQIEAAHGIKENT